MNNFGSKTSAPRNGAEFSTDKAFVEASRVVRSDVKSLTYSGIPLDRISEVEVATSSEEKHCFIIGDTGCGKTRRLIIPSIFLMGKSGESMVISDPKGELYRKTSGDLRNHGYDIKVVNMRSPSRGERWNPFSLVEKLYRSESDEDRDRAVLMLEDIIEVIHAPVRSNHDPYWENIALEFIKALIYIILENGEEGELSFGNLAVAERDMAYVMNNEPRRLEMYFSSLPEGSAIKENLSSIMSLVSADVGTTLGCALSTAETILSLYTRQKTIQNLLSTSDFNIEDIAKRPTALYIILPDDSEALYPLATLMVKQIYSTLINIADSIGTTLPNRVSFILDEFANFTRLESIGSMLTASRSRGIRFILVCQNVGQLEEKYGVYGAETIRSNCRIWVYMGSRNLAFLKMLQELSGIHVEKYGGDMYPLMDIDMLQRLKMGEVFIWNDRCSPKLCFLPDYSEYDFGDDDMSEVNLPEYHRSEDSAPFRFCEKVLGYPKEAIESSSFGEREEREGENTDQILNEILKVALAIKKEFSEKTIEPL